MIYMLVDSEVFAVYAGYSPRSPCLKMGHVSVYISPSLP